MENRTKSFKVDGKTYEIMMGHAAFYAMEQNTGEKFEDFLKRVAREDIGLKDVYHMLLASLEVARKRNLKEGKKGTKPDPYDLDDVLELIDDAGPGRLKEIVATVREALLASMPKDDGPKRGKAKDPQ